MHGLKLIDSCTLSRRFSDCKIEHFNLKFREGIYFKQDVLVLNINNIMILC